VAGTSNVPLRTYLGTVTDVPGLYHRLCPELLGLKAIVRVEFFRDRKCSELIITVNRCGLALLMKILVVSVRSNNGSKSKDQTNNEHSARMISLLSRGRLCNSYSVT